MSERVTWRELEEGTASRVPLMRDYMSLARAAAAVLRDLEGPGKFVSAQNIYALCLALPEGTREEP